MADLVVKWRRSKSSDEWVDFDVDDLKVKTLGSVCHLFSMRNMDVIALSGSEYVVSTDNLLKQYKRKKSRVRLFSDVLKKSDPALLARPFAAVGFGV